jgi:hypothetical protein
MKRKIGARQQAGVVTVLVCLAVAGCGGTDEAGGASAKPSSGSSDACAALGRFSVSFQATVDAVKGGDTQQVSGAVATLKDQYISVSKALQNTAPEAYDDITTAMTALTDAVARIPRGASDSRVASVRPYVTAVGNAVDDAEKSLKCPTS